MCQCKVHTRNDTNLKAWTRDKGLSQTIVNNPPLSVGAIVLSEINRTDSDSELSVCILRCIFR